MIKKIIKFVILNPYRRIIRWWEQFFWKNQIPLYWYNDKNWGDALNPVLVQLLSGKKARYTPHFFCDRFIAIGSILENANEQTEVWGSGYMRYDSNVIGKPKKIHAVRGPLTRENLLKNGIDCPEVFGDPALLFPFFYNPDVPKQYDIGIIPHYVDKNHHWIEKQRSESGVLVIDVRSDTWDFIRAVKSCKVILSSSLHGLICADAYGVPNAWILLSNFVTGGDFKFRDYRLSIGVEETKPIIIAENSDLGDIVSNVKKYYPNIDYVRLLHSCPFLSPDKKEEITGRILQNIKKQLIK